MTTMAVMDRAEPLGRRERKKRATRLALKAAALDLVVQRGFHSVTVEDIADAADVSVRTFFNYFASKEAALVGEEPELIEALHADLVGQPAGVSPLDACRAVLVARLRAIGEDIDLSGEGHEVWLRRMALVRAQPEVHAAHLKHLRVVEQALSEGLLERLGGDPSVRPYASLVAACALAVMRVAATYGGEGGTSGLIRSAEQGFDELASGLVPPARRPARSAARRSAATAAGRKS